MSSTKNFMEELADYVWLLEFADISFEERGRANALLRDYLINKFGTDSPEGFNGFYDSTYEMVEEYGGKDYAFGRMKERLLAMVRPDNELVTNK